MREFKDGVAVVTKYKCKRCGREFEETADAEACAARGLERHVNYKVGDIVIRDGYGWFDGDASWVAREYKEKRWAKMTMRELYYVVTAVDTNPRDPHVARYHLFTLAMSGRQGHREGNTTSGRFRRVRRPPEHIVQQAQKLLGRKAKFVF